MNALAERIARLIDAQGPLSVAQFMTMALHDPEAGYYAWREPIGATGDFITAPEVSQMFGELIGLWTAQVWHDQGRRAPARLVELGPGRGTLMADVLRAAKLMPEFLAAIEVVLVETSPVLKIAQDERLKDAGIRVSWVSRFQDVPADRPLFLLANEFFDALPIRQYVKTGRGWCERMVTVEKGALAFAAAPLPTPGLAAPDAAAEGAICEVSPTSAAITETVAGAIAANGGAALVVDYGYDAPGLGDTLQAVGGHEFRDVLDAPGEYDLSAHVNFPALADAALNAGAAVCGPVTQAHFLRALGIESRAAVLAAANPAMKDALDSQIYRLTGSDQMGDLFKAMAILPDEAWPPGF